MTNVASIPLYIAWLFTAVYLIMAIRHKMALAKNSREYDARQRWSIRDEWFTEPEKSGYQTFFFWLAILTWCFYAGLRWWL